MNDFYTYIVISKSICQAIFLKKFNLFEFIYKIIQKRIEMIVHYNEPIQNKMSYETLSGVKAHLTAFADTQPNNKT